MRHHLRSPSDPVGQWKQTWSIALAERPPAPIFNLALLVLLKEHKSNGYEVVSRLEGAGIRCGWSRVYRTLRRMTIDGHVAGEWDTTSGRGPARLVYSLTEDGEAWLEAALAALTTQAEVISELMSRYRRASDQDGGGA